MLSNTKHSLCLLLAKLQLLLNEFSNSSQHKEKKLEDTSLLIFTIIAQFELSIECANQLLFIEPSPINQLILLGITKLFVTFFNSHIIHVTSNEIFHTWATERAKFGVSLKLNQISKSLIHCRRWIYLEIFQKMHSKSMETTFRKINKTPISKIKQTFSELSIGEMKERKPLSFEEAVLIIQKLERFYKAARRRSVDVRPKVKRSIFTEKDAAVIIQSRVRGYLARRKVRQARKDELDLLELSIESVLRRKLDEPKEDILDISSFNLKQIKDRSIENLLDILNTNASIEEDYQENEPIVTDRVKIEKSYLLLLQRGILRKPDHIKRLCSLVSYISPVKYKGRVFQFDIRKFLEPLVIYPLMLSTWHIAHKPHWTLLVGPEKSGKSRWSEEIAIRTSATYLYVTARTVMSAPRALIQWILKLHQIDKTVLVAIDRLEQFPKHKSKDTSMKMLFRNFLAQLRQTNVSVIGMSRSTDLDSAIRALFEAEIDISYPDFAASYDLCVDLISFAWKNNQLRKLPPTIWDVMMNTTALNCGEIISNVKNVWFQN